MTAWTEGDVTVNGIRLHYYRTSDGIGDKPVLVMAHGLTDNGLCWSPLARALEEHFDLIMVDARGHGLSDKPDSGYSAFDHAEDLAAAVQSLGIAQAAFIGHSMGGEAVAILAVRYPQLVTRLILEDPAWGPEEIGTADDEEELAQIMQGFQDRITWRQAHTLEEVMADTRRLNPLWSDDELPAHAEAKYQVVSQALQYIGAPSQPWWEVVPALQCPTLVLTGEVERGAIISDSMAAAITNLNPLVTVVKLHGAAHNVRRDQFAQFLDEVRLFLEV